MAAKKDTKKAEPVKKEVEKTKTTPFLTKQRFVIIAGLLLLVAFVYFFKGLFVAAVVNGKPITRLELVRELEKQGGSQTLDSLVTQSLLLQEAKKQNITVSDQDIQNEITTIEQQLTDQGQNLDNLLSLDGITRAELAERIKLQLTVEKLAGDTVTVSDEEAKEYFEQNKTFYPEETEFESVKDSVVETLKQQKLTTAIQTLIQDLKDQASINYWVEL